MKMNFLPKNNKYAPRNKRKNLFLVSIFVLFIILIFAGSFLKFLLFTIGAPFWSIENNLTSLVSDNQEILKSKLSLINENNYLKEQLKSDEELKSIAEVVKKENTDLKSILNRGSSRYNKILSAVLVKPYLSPYDTLIIDAGLKDGISAGDKVLADGNNFIGYVSEAYDDSAKVVLYSSEGEKVKVLIGQNNIEKEVTGIGGGNFSIEMPKGIDIKEGDPIYMPSISANIFAVVEKIESKESDSFETILFKSMVNMSELKWVEVIVKNRS